MKTINDFLLERRILLQKQAKLIWSFVTFILLSMLIILSDQNSQERGIPLNDFIAYINIEDVIVQDNEREKKIKSLANNKHALALVVMVNSPGGTTYGSEQLYNALNYVKTKKPVISLIGSIAASGGYMTAIASDRIFAGNSSITGSIGVIMNSFDATELMEKIGIKAKDYKTSELKGAPSPFTKSSPLIDQAINETINDTYKFFVELVAKERKLTDQELQQIADGRVFTGRMALEKKLVDQIGNIDDVLEWLQKEKKIGKNVSLKEITLKESRPFRSLPDKIMAFANNLFSKLVLFY